MDLSEDSLPGALLLSHTTGRTARLAKVPFPDVPELPALQGPEQSVFCAEMRKMTFFHTGANLRFQKTYSSVVS